MGWRVVKHGILIAAHLGLAGAAVLALDGHRQERRESVAAVRQEAVEVGAWRVGMEQEWKVREALRQGVIAEDPYAVEMLLRTRLGWTGGASEQRPPPLPTR
jgi:hypothetical protein